MVPNRERAPNGEAILLMKQRGPDTRESNRHSGRVAFALANSRCNLSNGHCNKGAFVAAFLL